jgi:CheY-like chemotaxis protein
VGCHRVNAQPAADGSVDAEPSVARDRSQILIVDDSPVDRKIAAMLLSRGLNVGVENAEHGIEALAMIGENQPDLVLTDLNMPEMDGLSLVEAIRSRFPLVPTILMTAQGSEEIAMQALRRGAASYVAKRRLSADLVEIVRDVLAISQQDMQERRLHEYWGHTEFEFHLGSDATLVPALVSHLQRYLRSLRHCDETEMVRVGVALNEALQNAVYHGNLELDSELRQRSGDEYFREAESRRRREPFCRRRIRLLVRETRDEARYVVQDEGPGFDVARALKDDPTDPQNLTRPTGRGLFLIRNFMSEVQFNSAGNEITMIHRRPAGFGPHQPDDVRRDAVRPFKETPA